jgi:chromosome segregation protein
MLDGVILSLNRVEEHLISSESALAVHQKEKDALSHQAQSYQETLARYQANLAQVMAQLNVLEQAESSLSGYSEGVKVLLEEFHKKNKSWARGTLSNLVDVPTGLETAISVALGEFSDALIMRNPSDIDTALEILQTKSVRGSLLPLDEMKNFRPIQIDYDKAPVDKELILGLAWELVKTTEDLRPIIHVLLGHVLIVQDRNTAKRLLSSGIGRSFPYLRIVTINGELFHASGPVTGGASNQTSIHRKNKLKELRGLQQMLEPDIHEISEQIRTIYDDMVSWQTKDEQLRSGVTSLVGEEKRLRIEHRTYLSTFENHQRNLNWQKKQLGNLQDEIEHGVREIDLAETELTRLELMNQEKTESLKMEKARLNEISISDIQAETSYWATRMAVASRARDEAKKHVSELRMNLNRLQFSFDQSLQREQEMVAKLKALETDRLNTQSEIDSITIAVNELLKNIQPIEEEIHELEAQQSSLVSKDSEARQALSIAEHRYSQAKIIQANKQEAFNSLQKRIEDDLGLVMYSYDISISGPNPLPIAGMVQELPWVAELPADMDENINSQRALLRRIGPVNPEALVEFQQINERFEFLTQQVDDLKRAEAQIKEVITELDLLMEREFRKTFDAVAQEFRQIFTRLFGGGSARLVLTDPEEMTTTGIDIEARLPGRREQGLSLLSGGERSLTATALVFALLKVSPTPFCVLDEVDAMLDEANVGRFRDMLNELSEHTQFIVITHNRNTVQVADVIYGITMGRDSSSQVISLRMDEISEKYLR